MGQSLQLHLVELSVVARALIGFEDMPATTFPDYPLTIAQHESMPTRALAILMP